MACRRSIYTVFLTGDALVNCRVRVEADSQGQAERKAIKDAWENAQHWDVELHERPIVMSVEKGD